MHVFCIHIQIYVYTSHYIVAINDVILMPNFNNANVFLNELIFPSNTYLFL